MTGGAAEALLRLCTTDEVEEDLPLRVEVDDMGYAVFRMADAFYVLADLCSHGPGYLSDGFVEGCEVECPFHQGRFDIRTGAATAAPCEHPVLAWAPVVIDGAIHIDPTNPL